MIYQMSCGLICLKNPNILYILKRNTDNETSLEQKDLSKIIEIQGEGPIFLKNTPVKNKNNFKYCIIFACLTL